MKTLLQSINTDELLDIDYYIEAIQKLINLLHIISQDPIAKIAVGIVLFITILRIILKYRKN
jgi:hypothetical protein